MAEQKMNESYAQKLVEGLKPIVGIPTSGMIFKDNTDHLATKIVEEISTRFNIPELDNIMFTPRLAKSDVGAAEIVTMAFFTTNGGGNGNIYYRGGKNGKNNRSQNGRFNMVNVAGVAAGGTGPFATSDEFRKVFMPLCKTNEKGNPIFNIKSVQGMNGLAQIELDFNAVMCLALGVTPNDQYDFSVMNITPIPNTNNYNITLAKFIAGGGVKKGRNGEVNYNRISSELFNRYNSGNGGRNDNRRNY